MSTSSSLTDPVSGLPFPEFLLNPILLFCSCSLDSFSSFLATSSLLFFSNPRGKLSTTWRFPPWRSWQVFDDKLVHSVNRNMIRFSFLTRYEIKLMSFFQNIFAFNIFAEFIKLRYSWGRISFTEIPIAEFKVLVNCLEPSWTFSSNLKVLKGL